MISEPTTGWQNLAAIWQNLAGDAPQHRHIFVVLFNTFLLLTLNQLLLFIFRLKVWLPTRLAFSFAIGF